MTRGERGRAGAARQPGREGPKQRVQKALARAGIASRRQAEVLIAAGRVRVGGKRIQGQGMLVDPRRDNISVDGRRIEAEPLTYLLFHKPREVMCTMSDPLGRRSVTEYLRGVGSRVVPVGRLDYQTSGVLLLTNDGDFARELLHPSHGVFKEYLLKVKGGVDAAGLQRLRDRIQIAGKTTKPARVERVRADDNNTWLAVSLREGKNRQVRRLAEYAGYRVMRLTRTRFAGLSAEGLRPGQWRELSAAELRAVRAQSDPAEVDTSQDHVKRAAAPRAPRIKPPRARASLEKPGRRPRRAPERSPAGRQQPERTTLRRNQAGGEAPFASGTPRTSKRKRGAKRTKPAGMGTQPGRGPRRRRNEP
jgi:23S rRNA pseudouridine2605 synthase